MNLHSLSIALSSPSAQEQAVRKETLSTRLRTLSSVLLSFRRSRWVDFCWITCQCPRVVPAAQGSGMCSLCTELTFPFFPPLPLRTLPGPSLQFHSTSFNFLTGRGGSGARGAPTRPPCQYPPSPQPPPPWSSLAYKSPGKFGSVISGPARTRLCRNNPSSPPGG